MCIACLRAPAASWFDACIYGDTNRVTILKNRCKYLTDCRESEQNCIFGFTGAMHACHRDQIQILEILFEQSYQITTENYVKIGDFILGPNSNILHIAVVSGSTNCVQHIVKMMRARKQIQDFMNQTNLFGQSTLHMVAQSKKHQITDIITLNFDLFSKELENWDLSPIMQAVRLLDYDNVLFYLRLAKGACKKQIQEYLIQADPKSVLEQKTEDKSRQKKMKRLKKLFQTYLSGEDSDPIQSETGE